MKTTLALILVLGASLSVRAAFPTADTVTNSIGLKFKRIHAGTFQMGFEGRRLSGPALYGQYGDSLWNGMYVEQPQHTVILTQDFYMGVCEVTNEQFRKFRSDHPSGIQWYQGNAAAPAHRLTWFAADSFCEWLTAHDANGWTYRLPTEAEWEYCCRAGTTTWYSTGDTLLRSMANLNSGVYGWDVTVVMSYPANPWGLYDMYGNAKEWCLDWFGPYTAGPDTNPGGYAGGEQKALRGFVEEPCLARSAARGSLPPITRAEPVGGFRVVISPLLKTDLRYKALPDTLEPYQKNIRQNLPAPSTIVNGATWTDPDGRVFTRLRMNSLGHPSQWDSVVYVSQNPIPGDTGTIRRWAGLYARDLSLKFGVQYRLSNRYELAQAGILHPAGFHLTILPDIRYQAGYGHPDAAYFRWRQMNPVQISPSGGGPFYPGVNHVPVLGEAPNGDLLCSWYSGQTEDWVEQNTAVRRLRFGNDSWDSLASLAMDLSGYAESGGYAHNGKGRLLEEIWNWTWMNVGFLRYSDDNGVTWSAWREGGCLPITRWNGDTLLGLGDGVLLTTDGGLTAIPAAAKTPGFNKSMLVTDDGAIRVYVRGGDVANSEDTLTMGQYISTNLGASFTPMPTPFFPPGIGMFDFALKLHSGKILMAATAQQPYPEHCALVESDDSGRTWYCRRMLSEQPGTEFLRHHKFAVQGRDGIIHVVSTYGSGTGDGSNPHIAFSEQWLREGSCLDISAWGIGTDSMVAACPAPDTQGVPAVEQIGNPEMETLTASPNPFNPSTTFHCRLNRNGDIAIAIHDIRGRCVRTLHVKGSEQAVSVVWDGRDNGGLALSSGLYMAKLTIVRNRSKVLRLFLMK